LGEWRSFLGRRCIQRTGRGRLSSRYRADGVRTRPTGGTLAGWNGLERAQADFVRLCFRTGEPRPRAASFHNSGAVGSPSNYGSHCRPPQRGMPWLSRTSTSAPAFNYSDVTDSDCACAANCRGTQPSSSRVSGRAPAANSSAHSAVFPSLRRKTDRGGDVNTMRISVRLPPVR
jgi:hypothetical protein